MSEATRVQQEILTLFRAADANSTRGSDQLFAALYAELHRLAEQQLRRDGSDVTLSATTLLHEAYLDIAGRNGLDFPDRARFMGYAARAMRAIVIDHVRHSGAQKRGGGAFEITLGAAELVGSLDATIQFAELSEALDELAELEPALAELVDLHFFCGFGLTEIAALHGMSERTVQRNWRKARLLLRHALLGDGSVSSSE
ncbi:MAG: ECF-type sigma factor [bacterium]